MKCLMSRNIYISAAVVFILVALIPALWPFFKPRIRYLSLRGQAEVAADGISKLAFLLQNDPNDDSTEEWLEQILANAQTIQDYFNVLPEPPEVRDAGFEQILQSLATFVGLIGSISTIVLLWRKDIREVNKMSKERSKDPKLIIPSDS